MNKKEIKSSKYKPESSTKSKKTNYVVCLELWEVTPPLNSMQYLLKIKHVYAIVFIKQAENTLSEERALLEIKQPVKLCKCKKQRCETPGQ